MRIKLDFGQKFDSSRGLFTHAIGCHHALPGAFLASCRSRIFRKASSFLGRSYAPTKKIVYVCMYLSI